MFLPWAGDSRTSSLASLPTSYHSCSHDPRDRRASRLFFRIKVVGDGYPLINIFIEFFQVQYLKKYIFIHSPCFHLLHVLSHMPDGLRNHAAKTLTVCRHVASRLLSPLAPLDPASETEKRHGLGGEKQHGCLGSTRKPSISGK